MPSRPFALVTGASSGIGRELALLAARNGFDLLVAADDSGIHEAAQTFRAAGAAVDAVEADLATLPAVDRVVEALKGRPVDALFANAGHGLGRGFLDQAFDDIRHVIDTNVTGTMYLIHHVARQMRSRGQGRILITGSIAGYMPGTYQAVYNGSKAFLDSFSYALRAELKGTGITVTCLMPGPTDTHFFRRAGMEDTAVNAGTKDDPAKVARAGFDAVMRGDADVVTGLRNKIQSTLANILPSELVAERHRQMAEPGSAPRAAALRRWTIGAAVGLGVVAASAVALRARSSGR